MGGGNFFRGASSLEGLERATGDYVGMLATVMNSLCLQVGGAVPCTVCVHVVCLVPLLAMASSALRLHA